MRNWANLFGAAFSAAAILIVALGIYVPHFNAQNVFTSIFLLWLFHFLQQQDVEGIRDRLDRVQDRSGS